jgi:hypothetical protein
MGGDMADGDGGLGQTADQDSGSKFTLTLGDAELTDEESNAIQSDIINAAIERANDSIPDGATVFCNHTKSKRLVRQK